MKIKLTAISKEYVRPSDDPDYTEMNPEIMELGLSFEAIALLFAVASEERGEQTLGELKEKSSSDEVELFRAINELSEMGFVEKV